MIRRWYFRPLLVLLVIVVLAAAFVFIIRPWYFNWGATGAEIVQLMPGDELVAQPAMSYTRAITIRAPAKDVWPWLAQFGQAEGGMYSYQWIENGIGCQMTNADRIVPEWQTVSLGDEVRMCQPGFGPPPFLVSELEPGRALVMGHHPDGGGEGWTDSWAFVVSPIDAHSSRLFIRSRTMMAGGLWAAIEPGVFIMEYGALHGIKARAEAMAGG